MVQSGSTAHRRSKEILCNPTRTRTQRQRLRAAVSHGSSHSTAAEPPALGLSLKPSRGGSSLGEKEAGAGEGRAALATPDTAAGVDDPS